MRRLGRFRTRITGLDSLDQPRDSHPNDSGPMFTMILSPWMYWLGINANTPSEDYYNLKYLYVSTIAPKSVLDTDGC